MLYEILVRVTLDLVSGLNGPVGVAVATVPEPSGLTLTLLGLVPAGVGLWLGPVGHGWLQLDRQISQCGGDREPRLDLGVEPRSEEETPPARAMSAGKSQ
jgi:hypothetical protein